MIFLDGPDVCFKSVPNRPRNGAAADLVGGYEEGKGEGSLEGRGVDAAMEEHLQHNGAEIQAESRHNVSTLVYVHQSKCPFEGPAWKKKPTRYNYEPRRQQWDHIASLSAFLDRNLASTF